MACWWDNLKQNFPSDKATVAGTISIISLVFSVMNLVFLTCYAYFVEFFVAFASILIFTLVTGGPTFQLYYGLYTGDRKHASMWVVLKIVENLSAFVYLRCLFKTWYLYRYIDYFQAIIAGVVLIVLHVLYVVFVVHKARAMPLSHLEDLYATTTPFINDKSDISDAKESPVATI